MTFKYNPPIHQKFSIEIKYLIQCHLWESDQSPVRKIHSKKFQIKKKKMSSISNANNLSPSLQFCLLTIPANIFDYTLRNVIFTNSLDGFKQKRCWSLSSTLKFLAKTHSSNPEKQTKRRWFLFTDAQSVRKNISRAKIGALSSFARCR